MTIGLYTRWKRGEPREATVTPPLAIDHPLAGQMCLVCMSNLFGGNGTIPPPPRDILLLTLGVEPDALAEKDNSPTRWYTAVALALHASCALPGYVEGSLSTGITE